MRRNEVKELLPIIQAFAEGRPIQYKLKDCKTANWNDITGDYHEFSPHSFQYRIKPEPKYMPFKNAEECWNEMQKHKPFGWIKSKNDSTINKFMLIDSLRKDEVSISKIDFNYNDLAEYYIFADGTPFGMKEE